MAAGVKVILAGGALSKNIVWVVSSAVTANAGAHLEGMPPFFLHCPCSYVHSSSPPSF